MLEVRDPVGVRPVVAEVPAITVAEAAAGFHIKTAAVRLAW
jgi:hypothetical protein